MKRVLLACLTVFTMFTSKAQLLNEVMAIAPNCNSNGGGAEFFEVYGITEATSVNLDCYALVTFFNKKVGSGSTSTIETGFYVIDFPSTAIANPDPVSGKWWFVFGGKKNFCKASSSNVTANYSWNDPTNVNNVIVKKYLFNGSGYVLSEVSVDDLFVENDGTDFSHNAMLFSYQAGSKATLVNGIFANMAPSTIFPLAKAGLLSTSGMYPPDIPDAIACGTSSYSITFANLAGNSVEYTRSNAGSGNGYYRKSDGVCGSWDKASSDAEHTPGSSSTNQTSTEIYTISQVGNISCQQYPNEFLATIKFNYTSGDPYPIEYYIIKDNGNNILEPNTDDTYYGPLYVQKGEALNNEIQVTFPNSVEGDRYFIRARSVAGCFFATQVFTMPTCSPQPVTFSNFHAQRNRQAVALKWETLSEQNNRGFNVQRNTRGVWETVAFVFSQADGGNSDELLTYEFNDANSEKGVSQYRIQQVDLDGKASYSAIRSVKGLEQAGTRTVVYPNPSSDGKVNVVFEDQGAKAVTVSDMSGRVIRQYRNVLNNMQIEGLESGMYSIQITDLSSSVSSTEKVIIKKR